METKFNFKSQIATDKIQSERLLALGLKKDTSDMFYAALHFGTKVVGYRISPNYNDEQFEIFTDDIPAWSLHRLIEMMPMTLIEDRVYHEYWELNVTPIMVIYRNQDEPSEWIGECLGQGMYNNIIDCIEWLIKEGYFNKEYLV